MNGFKIEKETKKPGVRNEASKVALSALFGCIILGGVASCGGIIPTEGLPYTTTTIAVSKAEAVAIADSILSNELDIVMEHDILLTLSSNGQVIVFTADGCNQSDKIAYEYTGRCDYGWYETENEILSADETAFISNDTFYDWKIVEITGIYEEAISNRMIAFVTNLSN